MKRLFWLGVGAIAGASGTIWAERKVKTRLEALQPDHLAVAAGNRARDVGRSVVDAVADGRGAMRQREAELRREYDRDRTSSTPSADLHRPPAAPTRPRSGSWGGGGTYRGR